MKFIPSPNWNERPSGTTPSFLILHYTKLATLQESIDILTSPESQVSAHYLIDTNGDVYSLVPPEKRAWHAGVSQWGSIMNLNNDSIGIELQNPGPPTPFSSPQIESLIGLMGELRKLYPIEYILGHSDIAPLRKDDPGPLFPWEYLSQKGFGRWPGMTGEHKTISLLEGLKQLGYPLATDQEDKTIQAFQAHFYPENYGTPPNDETLRRLWGLL